MGLFDIFKKKKSPQEENFLLSLNEIYNTLKKRFEFQDGWTALNSTHPILSFNSPPGFQDLCIQVEPTCHFLQNSSQNDKILFDVSRQGDTDWQDIKKVIQNYNQTITFFDCRFSFSDLVNHPSQATLPRIDKHGGGVLGFWLHLPLPQKNPWIHSKDFDQVLSTCIEIGKKL